MKTPWSGLICIWARPADALGGLGDEPQLQVVGRGAVGLRVLGDGGVEPVGAGRIGHGRHPTTGMPELGRGRGDPLRARGRHAVLRDPRRPVLRRRRRRPCPARPLPRARRSRAGTRAADVVPRPVLGRADDLQRRPRPPAPADAPCPLRHRPDRARPLARPHAGRDRRARPTTGGAGGAARLHRHGRRGDAQPGAVRASIRTMATVRSASDRSGRVARPPATTSPSRLSPAPSGPACSAAVGAAARRADEPVPTTQAPRPASARALAGASGFGRRRGRREWPTTRPPSSASWPPSTPTRCPSGSGRPCGRCWATSCSGGWSVCRRAASLGTRAAAGRPPTSSPRGSTCWP